MKKPLIIVLVLIALLCVVGLIIGAAVYINNRNSGVSYTLIKEDGKVEFKTSASDSYQTMNDPEITLRSGSFVKTNGSSNAQVILPDNSVISLDQSTEIQVNVSPNNVNIQQLVGRTWNRVETVTNGGSYKVTTPTSVAAVRGTIFAVAYSDQGDESDKAADVYVEESKVEVSKVDNNQLTEATTIQSGEHINVLKSKAEFKLIKDTNVETFRKEAWYMRNKIIDDEYKALKSKTYPAFLERFKQRLEERRLELEKYNSPAANSSSDSSVSNLPFNISLPSFSSLGSNSSIDPLVTGKYICGNIDAAELQNSVTMLNQYRSFYANTKINIDALINYMNLLITDCKSGGINADQLAQLEAAAKAINAN